MNFMEYSSWTLNRIKSEIISFPDSFVALNVVVVVVLLLATVASYTRFTQSAHLSDTRLLICSTAHTRFFPVRHSFSYPLVYVFFRIDKPTTTPLFALDKWKLFHIRSKDYLGSPPCGASLEEKLRWHLEKHVHFIV